VGVAVVAVILLAIPQIEYRRDPKAYFLITEDYEAYKEYMASKKVIRPIRFPAEEPAFRPLRHPYEPQSRMTQ
jgi:hypothetical protein